MKRKNAGHGRAHQGKGSSRQFGNSTGNGRQQSGGAASNPKGAAGVQMTDRSNGRSRPTAPNNTDD